MSLTPLAAAVRVGLETLRANPLRTLLSTLGVVIGVASLVAVLSLGDGMERFGRERIRGEGYHVVQLASNDAETVDGVRVARDSYPVLTTAHAAELEHRLPAGTQVTMQLSGTGLVAVDGGRPRGTHVSGALPSADYPGLAMAHGRMFTAEEARARAAVAVVSRALADSLAGAGPASALVGRTVRFGTGQTRTVVGVFTPAGQPDLSSVVVPVDDAAAVMGSGTAAPGRPRTPTIEAHAPGIEGVAPLRAAVEAYAAARWPDWRRQVRVSSLGAERLRQLEEGVRLFKLFMGAIVSISLLVGGIGIMNVLLASVTERTREIGIRKTAGARNRDILRQFLAESVAVAGLGSAVGAVLGVVAAYGFTAAIRAMTEAQVYAAVTARTLALAVVVAVLVGLVFGTYPARRAARLSPIDAIRHE